MAYLDKPGLEAFWKKIKTWTSAHHATSMTKGASSQDGLQLMLKNGAESPTTLSTVTITKGDITALGIPGSDTKYAVVTQSDNGLMSSADKKKLDGVEANANHYVHPTAKSLATVALRKFSTNAQGHVISAETVTKADITALGIPGNTYTHPAGGAPSKAAGLYKFSTDSTSHVASVAAVTKADISPLESDPTVPDWAKAETKPQYNAAEIAWYGDSSVEDAINSKQDTIADLATIRAGAAKGATAIQTETDPTVPAWAKAATKPSYKASEIASDINVDLAGPTVADALESIDRDLTSFDSAISTMTLSKADKNSPTFTGTPKAPTAAAGTNTTQIATCAFVQSAVAAASTGAAKYQGGMTAASYSKLTTYKAGWYWIVTEAGTIAGESCEIGDMVFCNTDNAAAGTKKDAHFDIVQNNIDAIPLSVINALS